MCSRSDKAKPANRRDSQNMINNMRSFLRGLIPAHLRWRLMRYLSGVVDFGLQFFEGIDPIWRTDVEFVALYEICRSRSLMDMRRAFVLYQFAKLSAGVPGAIAEIGMYRGASAKLILHADNPLEQHVPMPVGLLRVDDGHVRPQRRHRSQLFARERAAYEPDIRVHLRQVRPAVSAKEGARHPRRSGFVGVRHGTVAALHDLQRARPAALHGVAQPVQRPDSRVAAPSSEQLLRDKYTIL